MTELWGLVIIGGPILLGLVMLFALIRNKTDRNQPPVEISEQGARDLRDQLNQEDKAGVRE